MHYVPAPLALRGFGSGFDSSRAQNPDPQRVRKGFFCARKQAFLLRMRTRHVRLTIVRRLQPRIPPR